MLTPRKITTLGAALVALGGALWLGPDLLGESAAEPTEVSAATSTDRSEVLARVRLTGDPAAMDAFVAEQIARCDATPDEAHVWCDLAEAHLERCLLRDTRKGMAVGEPTHESLPEANADDIEAGLAAADRAVELGEPGAEVHRIRSALLSLRVTGFGSALSNRPAIDAALKRAEEIDPNHPRVVVARACEKLFAPNSFLGHDPESARRMFLLAAEALPLDERPYVFASMCAWLLERNDEAVTLMEKATARNPNSLYAAEVLRRLRAGEDDPFGRDV